MFSIFAWRRRKTKETRVQMPRHRNVWNQLTGSWEPGSFSSIQEILLLIWADVITAVLIIFLVYSR
jgi:hypothetical protein